MASDVTSPPLVPSARAGITRSAAPAPPEDLAGVRLLRSIGWATLVGVWGAWLGSMIESAVTNGTEARIGAFIAGALLAACGAALAYFGSARHGVAEAAGRAVRDGFTFSWQGAWLGALVGGGLAATQGAVWVVALACGAVCVGGLVGFVGARRFGKERHAALGSALCGCLIAGFGASFLWAAHAPPAVAEAPAPAFGPAADWVWRTAVAVPLVVAAFVWWLRWMREERAKGAEAVGWGMGVAAFLFVAALAAGAGAMLGAFAQVGCAYLLRLAAVTPTPGTWLGAIAALFFWGLSQQPKRPA